MHIRCIEYTSYAMYIKCEQSDTFFYSVKKNLLVKFLVTWNYCAVLKLLFSYAFLSLSI